MAALVAATAGKASAAAQKSQAEKVRNQQAAVKAELKNATEIYSLRMGANGIAVRATVRDLLAIAENPNVVSISKLPVHRFDNATSVPWIEAANVWADLGFTGEGHTIGIIDTGIDYLHADFGGSGDVAKYDDNDPTTLSDGGFNAKVAGGYDFVGDDYDASTPGLDIPQPDEDPLDCHGHGSMLQVQPRARVFSWMEPRSPAPTT